MGLSVRNPWYCLGASLEQTYWSGHIKQTNAPKCVEGERSMSSSFSLHNTYIYESKTTPDWPDVLFAHILTVVTCPHNFPDKKYKSCKYDKSTETK